MNKEDVGLGVVLRSIAEMNHSMKFLAARERGMEGGQTLARYLSTSLIPSAPLTPPWAGTRSLVTFSFTREVAQPTRGPFLRSPL